jgi:hypothetical protein
MITELTPEQKAQLKVYAEKWRKIGLSTESTNREKVKQLLRSTYQRAGLSTPEQFQWVNSPLELWNAAGPVMDINTIQSLNRLKSADWESVVFQIGYDRLLEIELIKRRHLTIFDINRFYVAPQLDGVTPHSGNYKQLRWQIITSSRSGMTYDYSYYILGIEHAKQGLDQSQIEKYSGLWIPCSNVCFVVERPNTLNWDNQDQPHCEDGLAIGYPDGWGVYAWHGVRVPEYVIMRPHKITPDKIMSEANAEVSRVMIERYGQDNFIRNGGFSKVQSDDYGDLYRVEFKNGDEPIVAVHVQDASTYRDYFLYVPPHIHSAHEGVAWTFGYDNVSDYNPDQET